MLLYDVLIDGVVLKSVNKLYKTQVSLNSLENKFTNEISEINSNLLEKQTSGEKIYTKKELSVAPSQTAFENAPIRTDGNVANGSRAGIGFHNVGYNGGFLYLETDDNNLYLILNNGNKYKINMTLVNQ